MIMGWKVLSGQMAAHELTLSKTQLAGGQKQNQTFSILLLEFLLWLIA